mmetsp:Transcript_11704/g.25680  ORF Transcript_11704/g.25680 Transcript_11704/m.25680 type:complete len:231 (-) Transcript_11704:791-1483(-)
MPKSITSRGAGQPISRTRLTNNYKRKNPTLATRTAAGADDGKNRPLRPLRDRGVHRPNRQCHHRRRHRRGDTGKRAAIITTRRRSQRTIMILYNFCNRMPWSCSSSNNNNNNNSNNRNSNKVSNQVMLRVITVLISVGEVTAVRIRSTITASLQFPMPCSSSSSNNNKVGNRMVSRMSTAPISVVVAITAPISADAVTAVPKRWTIAKLCLLREQSPRMKSKMRVKLLPT